MVVILHATHAFFFFHGHTLIQISLKFVPKGPIDDKSELFQAMM